ncbi:hypothetical protein THIOSC15_460001 [uncultured Thiomicrorhabdus sp.]
MGLLESQIREATRKAEIDRLNSLDSRIAARDLEQRIEQGDDTLNRIAGVTPKFDAYLQTVNSARGVEKARKDLRAVKK